MSTRTRTTPDARERLLEAADRLFYRDGIRAAGVDTIIAEAGVAKMTLYSHFASKDQLIAEYLRRRGLAVRAWLAEATARHAAKSPDRLAALFAALKEWFALPDFRGCAFQNAAAELPDPAHPGRAAVVEHRALFAALVADVLRADRVRDPESAAAGVVLLIDGAIVAAGCGGAAEAADRAHAAARKLLGRGR